MAINTAAQFYDEVVELVEEIPSQEADSMEVVGLLDIGGREFVVKDIVIDENDRIVINLGNPK